MTRLQLQTQIKTLRDELETRHQTGAVKIASADGKPVPTQALQDKLFYLIYKLSKIE